MSDSATPTLVERLLKRAAVISETSKQMAEWKSLRQTDNPEGRTDLYSYIKPEQTDEYEAAVAIMELTEALGSLLNPDSHHTVSGIAYFQLRQTYDKYKDGLKDMPLTDSSTVTCNRCGAKYSKAPLSHIHKCGYCSEGYCQ